MIARTLTEQQETTGTGSRAVPSLRPDPAARYEPFPLTDIQRAYWLGRNPAYELGGVGIHVYEEIDVVDLDVPRLDEAWRRVIERHDMLRAVVLPCGEQQVLRDPVYRIETLDLRGLSADARAAELTRLRESMSHRVYVPTEWPLFSIVACRLDSRLTRLLVSFDALNVDMGSFKIVFGEWVALYADRSCPLPRLSISYRDYVLALSRIRETDEYTRSQAYWQERAQHLAPAPELPMAAQFSALPANRFERRSGRLEARRWDRLKARAAAHGLTPSGVTLAMYRDVLATWSRSPEFTINVTLFNRLPVHPDIGDVVGDFTSVVLLGTGRPEGASRADHARRLQRQLWREMEHRWVSGVHTLRDIARLQGRRGGEALMPYVFTSTLSVKARGLLPLHALGTRVYSLIQTPQVCLDLHVSEDRGELAYNLDAVAALFPPGLLDDFFAAYATQIERLADQDQAWTERARALTPSAHLERRRRMNATAAPRRAVRLETICRGGERDLSQPAVITSHRTLSYEELRRLATTVATRLSQAGIARGDRVAILLEKRWEQVPAVLGILQAGAAYVPIDPQWPEARRTGVLDEADAAAVIVPDRGLVKTIGRARVLTIADLMSEVIAPVENAIAVAPDDIAYVLYTSGSTGRPKGVAIEHHSVVNRIDDVNQRFGVEGDRILALTALHHDLSVYDLFGMLASGGALVLPDAARLLDPRHWIELMERHGVTIWNSVPAFMEMLVVHLEATPADARRVDRLRRVLLSGDRIAVDLPPRIRACLPRARIVSLGGPTETTIWDICFPLESSASGGERIPYGRPMTNATYHVLDEALDPRPDWVAGELHIGGAGLAREYWGDGARTAERFISHPETGERLFRSGDLGRVLPDGTIDILGRVDQQLKLRGYRIEAGEIEQHLRRDSGVQQAVVAIAGTSDRDRRLVAYVVPAPEIDAPVPSAVTEERLAIAAWKSKRPGLRHDVAGCHAVGLASPAAPDAAVYRARSSCRRFTSDTVPARAIGQLLGCLRSMPLDTTALPKYRYPSAGSLYAVQTYIHAVRDRVEGVPAGFHYYDPDRHTLAHLADGDLPVDTHLPHNRQLARGSAFTLLLYADLAASTPVYGERAREFAFVEAGCMAQLLMTEAAAAGVGLCAIGALPDGRIRGALSLTADHVLALSLAGGIPDAGGRGPLEARLRARLAASVPEHMIPSEFVFLDRLPLSSNGKVDRARLPRPATGRCAAAGAEGGTPEERIVAQTVREVLQVERAANDVRLLDLGANSLQIVQIAAMLSQRLGFDVPVMSLLEHPTIRAIADHVEQLVRMR